MQWRRCSFTTGSQADCWCLRLQHSATSLDIQPSEVDVMPFLSSQNIAPCQLRFSCTLFACLPTLLVWLFLLSRSDAPSPSSSPSSFQTFNFLSSAKVARCVLLLSKTAHRIGPDFFRDSWAFSGKVSVEETTVPDLYEN